MILITGCAGFIGSHLAELLLKDEEVIVGIDNFDPYYNISLKKRNLAALTRYNNFTFLSLDITDKNVMAKLFNEYKFTTIVHLAARPGVAASLRNPLTYAAINISGTLNLLEQIKRLSNVQFIFASSSSVYAGVKKTPFSETDDTYIQLSPYGASKKSAENYCRLYHDLYGISVTILRFFTVYGPRVRPDMAVIKFIKAIGQGEEITVYNKGEVERDYTYIDDIVSGIRKAIKKKYYYEIINLGNSHPVKLKTVIQLLEESLGKKAKIKDASLPKSEMVRTWANISKAKKLLHWIPKIAIEEGIEKLVRWYKQNNRYG